MNRFNLTFWGEILPGKDPEQVKERFARLFGITDPERLDHFFTGETITLRRNLDRKVAGEYYHKLHKLGVEAELVKVTAETSLPDPERAPEAAAGGSHSDWEQARQQAEREALARRTRDAAQRREAKRKQQEEEAERQREAEEAARRETEEAARLKAEREAEKKRAAEDAARRETEEAARLKAEREAEKKRAAEEAARRKAEEAARLKAEREAEKKRAAEEAARLKAEREAERQRKAEESARRKAAAAEARRLHAEAAAQKKAEEAEKRRRAAEAAAKKKAAEEEQQRLAAEQAAQEKAAAEAERKQRELEAARIAAEIAEQERQAKAEQARIRAEKKQAEKRQREQERKRRAEAEARRRAAEKEARRKQQAAEARAEQEARQRARELEEKAIARGAQALADSGTIKARQARVKSRIELPRRSTAYHSGKASQSRGAPNLYQLRPFRNTSEVRERPALAREKQRKAVLSATAAFAVLLLTLGRLLALPSTEELAGPTALAASAGGELAMLAGDEILLHDRAGVHKHSVSASELGLRGLSPPLAYTPSGELLLAATALEEPGAGLQPWQCKLDEKRCSALALARVPDALSVHPLSGELFLADHGAQSLAKWGADGSALASTTRTLAENPVLRLESGLLFLNSSEGPAVSVLRYENQAFGQQLDEILLLPPAALEAEQTRVWDFASSGSHWWVILYNPGTGSSGLYLFDRDWNFIEQLPGQQASPPGRLLKWGSKILLYHPQQAQVRRFSATGKPEAPLASEALQALIETRASGQRLGRLAWSLGLLLLLLIVLASLARAYLQASRALVYRGRPSSGAAPLDDIADDIRWIDAAAKRGQQLKHASVALAVLALAVTLLLVGLGVSPATLVGAMLALLGPLLALQLLLRSEREYLGTWNQHLVLVDHRRLYHLASGARVQYRGPFLLVDDVVVFTGTPLLPALDAEAINREVAPLAQAGVRVDRKTLLVKLLESHHPLARGGQVAALCLLAGLLVIILGQLPWQG